MCIDGDCPYEKTPIEESATKISNALPSYAGKEKTSLKLIQSSWSLAQERAQKLWPRQKINRSDLAQWLVERFLEETNENEEKPMAPILPEIPSPEQINENMWSL